MEDNFSTGWGWGGGRWWLWCTLFLLTFFNLLNFLLFTCYFLYLAALGLCRLAWAFSNCREQGLLLTVVLRHLIAVACLVTELRLEALGLQSLQHTGSVAVVHGLSCPMACGIFLDQGSNPCPLHCRQILIHWATREVLFLLVLHQLHLRSSGIRSQKLVTPDLMST